MMFHRHKWIVVANEGWTVENVWTRGRKPVVVTRLRCECGKRRVLENTISFAMARELYPLGKQVKP